MGLGTICQANWHASLDQIQKDYKEVMLYIHSPIIPYLYAYFG